MVIAYRDYRGLGERFWVPKRDSEYVSECGGGDSGGGST